MSNTSLAEVLDLFFEENPAPFCIFERSTGLVLRANPAWQQQDRPDGAFLMAQKGFQSAGRFCFEGAFAALPFTCFSLSKELFAVQMLKDSAARIQQLETLSDRKSELISHLSHELRTPLTAILGWPEMILDSQEQMPVLAVQAAEAIQRDGKFLNQLLESLLDLSQIEAGRMQLQREWVDLRVLCDAAVEMLQERTRFKHLTLTLRYPDKPMYVYGDSIKIRQAMLNYIANAIKYTPEKGAIVVTLRRTETDFVFSVHDNGRGLRPELQSHIFERYVRAEDVLTVPGAGLGLALVKKLLDLHGGSYWLESEPGQGSTFFFSLPVPDEAPLVLPEIRVLCVVKSEQERLDLASFFKHHPVTYKIEEHLPGLQQLSASEYDLILVSTDVSRTADHAWCQAVHTLYPQQFILALCFGEHPEEDTPLPEPLGAYDGVLYTPLQTGDLLQYIQKRRE